MKPLKLLCLVLPLTLIAAGFKSEPEKANEFSKSLLQAASDGNIEKVKSLLSKGADVNARDERGLTPLHHAASNGHNDIVDLLIAKGADTNGKDKWGYTPLYYTIWSQHKDIVKLLVAKGADVSLKPEKDYPPLHYAVWMEDVDIVKVVVDNGAKFDVKDQDGWTAFRYAASQGSRDMVEFFVSKGADVSTFHLAACVGDLIRVQDFVQQGTDVDEKDEMDWTALYWAASTGQTDVAEFLIASGADVDAKAEDSSTLLHQAARAGSVKLVKLLIAKGADVNANDKRANTSLHSAASKGHREVAGLLIAKGADVNAIGRNGWTPLHNAARQGHRDVVELLLSKGSDINAKDKQGRTPLDLAQKAEHEKMVELLMVHNVAVTKVSAPPSCVQGETVSIVIALENRGDCGEFCTIKLMDDTNDREIARQSATIHSKHRTASEADLTLTGETGTTGSFGNWCWADGDVNGDGFNDLLITAPNYPDNIDPKDGRVYLYYGGTNMTASAAKTFDPENAGDWLGNNNGMFADINNDNFDDIIIGARYYGSGDEGRVYVYYGGEDMDLTPDIYLDLPSGEGTNASLGRGGISVGDLNNDGYMDLVASAIRYPNGTKQGRVYLWYGPLASDTTVDKTFTGESNSYCYGAILSARGDVNGDNCDDLLIAHRYYPNNTGVGRAYLYWGAEGTAMDTTADVIFDCPDSGANEFGSAADLFDIDNDGCAEVIIGARRYPGDGSSKGRVYLYWGKPSGFDNTVGMYFDGESTGVSLGGDFIHGGYADDDQYGDLIITGYDYPAYNRQSRAYLYYGSTQGGMDNVCDHTFTGEANGFDAYRATLSDLNNDGYGDVVLAGAGYPGLTYQGRCLLWYGPFDTTTDITFNWNTINVSPGKHTLRASIVPIAGEEDTADNTMTVTVEVKGPYK